jgi:hypothetical protein
LEPEVATFPHYVATALIVAAGERKGQYRNNGIKDEGERRGEERRKEGRRKKRNKQRKEKEKLRRFKGNI